MGIFDIFRKKEEPEELDTDALQKLGYPYTILQKNLTKEALMLIYWEARERGRKEGFTPILIPAEDAVFWEEALEGEETYSAEEAAALDGEEILSKRLQELTDPQDTEIEPLLMDEEFLGTLENGDDVHDFAVLELNEGSRIVLFELPTVKPWEVVLYLPFGGWNECPLPEENAAVLRYWYEKWGAVPAVMTHDTLELVLPASVPKDQVWDVAKEHFAFTEDSVFQGTGTLGALADGLWKSDVWFFWWD